MASFDEIVKGQLIGSTVLPLIPPVDDVAVPRADAVQEVPASVAAADPVMPAPKQAKRQPVNFQYHRLNWEFIKLLAQIANYADSKYGAVEQYTDSKLVGEKSPMNHIAEHMRQYLCREPHDHFKDTAYHLAAIAYNAMMEFYYLKHGGATTDSCAILYGIKNPASRKEDRTYMERAAE